MVRSKHEGDLLRERELFHLVEQIRGEEKYFDVSRSELVRRLTAARSHEEYCDHDTTDHDGATVSPMLRVNLAARGPGLFSASLKLHKICIDQIDYETIFDLPDGSKAYGWHRHRWDALAKSAKRLKAPLPNFGDGLLQGDADTFLIRAFREMRILLNSYDDAPDLFND